MPLFLLDTNTCIYIRQNRPEQVEARFRRLPTGDAVMSMISFGELRYGAEKSRARDRSIAVLNELSALIPVEPLPKLAAAAYGSIRADLEARGLMISANDLWIAAHALTAGLTLVTNNEREFRRVPNLKIENWVAS